MSFQVDREDHSQSWALGPAIRACCHECQACFKTSPGQLLLATLSPTRSYSCEAKECQSLCCTTADLAQRCCQRPCGLFLKSKHKHQRQHQLQHQLQLRSSANLKKYLQKTLQTGKSSQEKSQRLGEATALDQTPTPPCQVSDQPLSGPFAPGKAKSRSRSSPKARARDKGAPCPRATPSGPAPAPTCEDSCRDSDQPLPCEDSCRDAEKSGEAKDSTGCEDSECCNPNVGKTDASTSKKKKPTGGCEYSECCKTDAGEATAESPRAAAKATDTLADSCDDSECCTSPATSKKKPTAPTGPCDDSECCTSPATSKKKPTAPTGPCEDSECCKSDAEEPKDGSCEGSECCKSHANQSKDGSCEGSECCKTDAKGKQPFASDESKGCEISCCQSDGSDGTEILTPSKAQARGKGVAQGKVRGKAQGKVREKGQGKVREKGQGKVREKGQGKVREQLQDKCCKDEGCTKGPVESLRSKKPKSSDPCCEDEGCTKEGREEADEGSCRVEMADSPAPAPSGESSRVMFKVVGMTCSDCQASLSARLAKLPGVFSHRVALLTGLAEVTYDPKMLTNEDIKTTIGQLSYKASLLGDAGRALVRLALPPALPASLEPPLQLQQVKDTICDEVTAIKGVYSVEFEDPSGPATENSLLLSISFDPNATGNRSLSAAVGRSAEARWPGVQATPVAPEPTSDDSSATAEMLKLRRNFLVAFFLTVPVVLNSFVLPAFQLSNAAIHTLLYNSFTIQMLVGFVFVTPIQLIFSYPIAKSAWGAMRYARRANADTLVTLSTGVAYLYSVGVCIASLADATVGGAFEAFFETSAILLTLILLGRFLELQGKKQTNTSISALMKLQPSTALLLGKSDAPQALAAQPQEVETYLLERGDVIKVLPFAAIGTDGQIVAGDSHVDESMLTGEPRPVHKLPQAQVFGGTMNKEGVLFVRVTRMVGENTLAKVARQIEQTQMAKAPIERVADRMAAWFVPLILAATVVVFVVWMSVRSVGIVDDPTVAPLPFALKFAIALLVVACPCALGLAAPTAIMVGTGVAARHGVLFKSGATIEALARVEVVGLDKTFTLTTGLLSIHKVILFNKTHDKKARKKEIVELAASGESGSEHPVAQAFLRAVHGHPPYPPRKTKITPGEGITATIKREPEEGGEVSVSIGNERFLRLSLRLLATAQPLPKSEAIESELKGGRTVVFVAIGGVLEAAVSITDTIRPESKFVISELQLKGIEVWMITGDNEKTALAVAAEVGIAPARVKAHALPADKAQKIAELQNVGGKKRRCVAMCGDGINDSVALAAADVGVAIGSVDLVQQTADLVLMHPNLKSLMLAIDVSQSIYRRIKMNLSWAMIYNSIAIPLAAGVLWPVSFVIPPPLAGLGEILSSIPVIILSILLKRYSAPKQYVD